MIKTTVGELVVAYRAFRRMGEELRLPQKAAWRVSRLTSKMKSAAEQMGETEQKLIKDAGGFVRGDQVVFNPPERVDGMKAEDYSKLLTEHKAKMIQFAEDMKAQNKEEVEIDYDPISLSLFDRPGDEKGQGFSFNDIQDAGPFLTE
jgi:hypothetical protein